MTAALYRSATGSGVSPLVPVLSALAVMRVRHGDKVVAGMSPAVVVDPSSGDGWNPATDLLDSDAALDALLDAGKQRWKAHDHVNASMVWKAYTRWLALPAVLGFATAHRVPDVSPENVLYRFDPEAKHFLTLGLRRAALTALSGDPTPGIADHVADEAALLAVLRSQLVDRHLAPLMDRFRARVHIGRRSLWGSLASGVGQMISRSAEALPGSTLDTAHAVLGALDIADLVELAPQPGGSLEVTRRTCCLSFTLPEPKFCSGCVVRAAGAVD